MDIGQCVERFPENARQLVLLQATRVEAAAPPAKGNGTGRQKHLAKTSGSSRLKAGEGTSLTQNSTASFSNLMLLSVTTHKPVIDSCPSRPCTARTQVLVTGAACLLQGAHTGP